MQNQGSFVTNSTGEIVDPVAGRATHDRYERQVRRTRGLIRADAQIFRFTDLTLTKFADTRSRFFRLFTPIKESRGRLPTTLPGFSAARYTANLSDSPVTAAAQLGGSWQDHNLAAITHVAACNLRCPYCYVDFRHLAGHDSFQATPRDVVDDFTRLRSELREIDSDLTILRVSGGEPLLTPELPAMISEIVSERDMQREVLVKVESNLTALAAAMSALDISMRRRVELAAPTLTVHATIHLTPRDAQYPSILAGISCALGLGMDLYPAIGGLAWSEDDMSQLYDDLAALNPGLPARLAVRPFQLDYPVLRSRRKVRELREEARDRPVMVWSQLLASRAGLDYLATPRHAVPL